VRVRFHTCGSEKGSFSRLVYHSTLGVRVVKKEKEDAGDAFVSASTPALRFRVQVVGCGMEGVECWRVQGVGCRV